MASKRLPWTAAVLLALPLVLVVPPASAGHGPATCSDFETLVVLNSPALECSVTLTCPQNFDGADGHRYCVWQCTATLAGGGLMDVYGCGSSCPSGLGLPGACAVGPTPVDVNEGESVRMSCGSEGLTTGTFVTLVCAYTL